MLWNFLEPDRLHPVFVPCLLDLLDSPRIRCRGRILDWLGCMCHWRHPYEAEDEEPTTTQVATRAVLWGGLDRLLALLDDERLSVRTSAPFLLAMLVDACRGQVPPSLAATHPEARIAAALARRLDVETHSIARSSLILAMGYAGKRQPQLMGRLRTLSVEEGEGHASVRLACAMALAVCDPDIPDEALEQLAQEVQEHPGDSMMRGHFSLDTGLEARHNPLVKAYARLDAPIGPAAGAEDDAGAFEEVLFPWTYGECRVLTATRALCMIKPSRSQSVRQALIRSVAVCHDSQSADILEPILPVVFQGRVLSAETRRADLTDFEYAVLRAIYDNPLMWPGGNTYEAFGSVGLPQHRRDWRRLLEITDGPDADTYYERLARCRNRLPDGAAVTEEHYRNFLMLCLYHMVDNRYIPLLARFPMLESLVIQPDVDGEPDGFTIDGEGISQLPVLPRLTHLYIRGVDAVDIPQIGGCRALMLLDLARTHVGDRFIRRLRGLPRLGNLYLWETRITDACLEELPSLPALVALDVCSTAISDEGIADLAKLTGLQSLRIHSANITEDGYRRLQGALPRCRIEWSPPG
jgi:hypothetical protein